MLCMVNSYIELRRVRPNFITMIAVRFWLQNGKTTPSKLLFVNQWVDATSVSFTLHGVNMNIGVPVV